MALRVLLADESSTIKKAVQMVLSEYGVEIKTVPTGIDVMAVAQSFGPDLIIADVLLNTKNGYEVCKELKASPATQSIPVILMWSSFMQLDDLLYNESKADASVEKPFDTDTIKALVERLVPKLQNFPLKGFLNHPSLPDFEESDTFVRQKNNYHTLAPNSDLEEATAILNARAEIPHQTKSAFILDESTKTKIPRVNKSIIEVPVVDESDEHPGADTGGADADQWAPARTNQITIETESFGDFEEVKVISNISENTTEAKKKLNEQIQSYLKDSPVASHKAKSALQNQSQLSSFDEQLMREEIRQIAEKVCWQIIPEITEKIVRDELNKLLEGIDKSL